MIVRDGTCSTFFTLPPLPCPSSCKSFRSSSRKSYLTSAFRSRLARVFDSVVWYVMRFALADGVPLAGADEGAGATATKPSTADDDSPVAGVSAGTLGLRFIGGGRFFPPPAPCLLAGARRVGTGSVTSGGEGGLETSSASDLKLRFERRGRLMVVLCTKGLWKEKYKAEGRWELRWEQLSRKREGERSEWQGQDKTETEMSRF